MSLAERGGTLLLRPRSPLGSPSWRQKQVLSWPGAQAAFQPTLSSLTGCLRALHQQSGQTLPPQRGRRLPAPFSARAAALPLPLSPRQVPGKRCTLLPGSFSRTAWAGFSGWSQRLAPGPWPPGAEQGRTTAPRY